MVYYLVQGDTGSQIKVSLARYGTKDEVDLTSATTFLKVRKEKAAELAFTVTGLLEVGTINSTVFVLGDNMIDIEPGRYEGEISVIFGTVGGQTAEESVFETIQLYIREEF